jgi:hypothetical protein
MALPPPKRREMEAFYLVFEPMELSAGLGYTTPGKDVTESSVEESSNDCKYKNVNH